MRKFIEIIHVKGVAMGLKVGITTFHSLYNFGSLLQAFALQRAISEFGNASKIVNYIRSGHGTAHQMFHRPTSRSSVTHNIVSLSTIRSQFKLRRHFSEFRRNLEMTAKAYHTGDAIKADSSLFDAYVTGSDMVWNPAWLAQPYAPVYYLDFVETERRIAYAPSFGVSEIPAEHRGRIAAYLRSFDYLSAREESGSKIIRELIGRQVPLVLDPTLLQPRTVYDSLVIEPDINKYILLYPMHWSPDLCRMAMIVRERLKIPLIAVVPIYGNPWKYRFADKVVYDAGPAEFLGWLKYADFVCTNSFHGSVFSIIYQKQFLSSSVSKTNTRLHNLFNRSGLLSRQIIELSEMHNDKWIDAINYDSVENRLAPDIEKSKEYLRGSLA